MAKKNIIGLSFLIILIVALIAYFNFKTKVISPLSTQPIGESQTLRQDVTSKSFVKIVCPDTDKPEINKIVKEKIAQILADEGMSDAIQVSEIPEGNNVEWLEINCAPIPLDGQIFALKFDISSYGTGSAHPNQDTKTLSYSIDSHKELEIKDLFTPNSNYLELLSKQSRIYLKERLSKTYFEMIDDGTLPKESNYSSFLVGENGLTIFFNPYEVAPYSEGTQEVLIPSAQLKPDYLY